MKVQDVMTRDVITVTPETPLRDVAAVLAERRISGVPVAVGDACIGIVSEADLLPKQLSRGLSKRGPLEWIFGDQHDPEELRRRAATTAAGAMSSPAITIRPEASVHEAAALMVDSDVNRLPVVADGAMVGIVTRADLVRAYLRQDADIAFAVRERVLRLGHPFTWEDAMVPWQPGTADPVVGTATVRCPNGTTYSVATGTVFECPR